MYFIPETAQLIFGGLNINNKYCSTFTFMYLGYEETKMRVSVKDHYGDSNGKKSQQETLKTYVLQKAFV